MSSERSRLGGLGAVFFLAALGGIAFYVQGQAIPQEHDSLRKPATVLPQVEEDPPAPLPWNDRLDLGALELMAVKEIDTAPSVPKDSDQAPLPSTSTVKEQEQIDPGSSRYVQFLNDGHRLLFTLDPVMQESALTILKKYEIPFGAVVAIDLRDNSVLTMAGHSAMNPEVSPLEILNTAWAPAASVFKLVTAASLLENQKANKNSRICFHGGLHGITDELLKNDATKDSRCETLSSAIAHSYNLVIAKLALNHLDQDELLKTAHSLQFESEISFEFPVEASPANIPSDSKARARVAAGFWHVDLSPMHAAILASIFARGGMYQPLHIIQQVMAPDGSDLTPVNPEPSRALAKDVAKGVAKMMEGTTTRGTARKGFFDQQGSPYIPGVKVAGKTGSLTGKRAPALNYNWFVGFAPADDPQIAFSVIVANTPKWRIKAHYLARRMIQIYRQRNPSIDEQRLARFDSEGQLQLPARDSETGALLANSAPKAVDINQAQQGKPASAPTPAALPPTPTPTSP